MQHVFTVTLPFFLVILCGYLAVRSRLIPVDAILGLNGFVLFFALPCMLYRFAAGTAIDELLDVGVFTVYLLCALIMVGLTIATTHKGAIRLNDAAFGALVAAFPNAGFMGLPLLISLLGAQAAGPVIVSIAVDMVITSSICIAISQWSMSRGRGTGAAIAAAFKGVSVNPLPWAILLGGVASATAIQLPSPLMRTVDVLADASSPAALFIIGGVLARSQMKVTERYPGKPRWGDVPQIVFFKLVLHPLIVLAVGYTAISAGLPLDSFSLAVLVLLATLPSASNVPMLSERFGADTDRIARIVLFSTLLSFLTFSSAVALYSS